MPEEDVGDAVTDHGAPDLPFTSLDDRAFEILSYRLLSAELPDHVVTLMQGVGERGRDVLVYHGGSLQRIIQCKRYKARLTTSDVLEAVGKLGLHEYSSRDILNPTEVTIIELWAPSGLSESANAIVDAWETAGWSGDQAATAVDICRQKYRALGALAPDEAIDWLCAEFPARVKLRKVVSADLSPRVRQRPALYETFFVGRILMDRTDVQQELSRILADAAWRRVSDDDHRALLDRLGHFAPEERTNLLSARLFGIRPSFIARLERQEMREVATTLARLSLGLAGVFIRCADRLAQDLVVQARPYFSFTNPSFAHAVRVVLARRAVSRVSSPLEIAGVSDDMPAIKDRLLSDDQLIMDTCAHIWVDALKVIRRLQGKALDPGSDDELRLGLAHHTVHGFDKKDAFVASLQGDFSRNSRLVAELLAEVIQIVPAEWVVVGDSIHALRGDQSLDAGLRDIGEIERIRAARKRDM